MDPPDLRTLPALLHLAGDGRALGQGVPAGPGHCRHMAEEVLRTVAGSQDVVRRMGCAPIGTISY